MTPEDPAGPANTTSPGTPVTKPRRRRRATTGDGTDEPEIRKPKASSSPAFSRERQELLFKTVSRLVEAFTAMVHVIRRRRLPPGYQGPPLWLADDTDKQVIAGPAASILGRRIPFDNEEASDVLDGITVAVGVAGYVTKNIVAEETLRHPPKPPVITPTPEQGAPA